MRCPKNHIHIWTLSVNPRILGVRVVSSRLLVASSRGGGFVQSFPPILRDSCWCKSLGFLWISLFRTYPEFKRRVEGADAKRGHASQLVFKFCGGTLKKCVHSLSIPPLFGNYLSRPLWAPRIPATWSSATAPRSRSCPPPFPSARPQLSPSTRRPGWAEINICRDLQRFVKICQN